MDEIKFIQGMKQLNISVTDIQAKQFVMFEKLLLEWNERMNLTAITDAFEIMTKHFFDSVIPLAAYSIPSNASVIDIGTGAGFPAIPLKIMRSDISITLLDSLYKRLTFLNEVINTLDLQNAQCIHARAEDAAHDTKFRERFDVVVSRAVAGMDVLTELCLPYVKVGGVFLAMKSSGSDDEINLARAMIGNLGGTIEGEFTAEIPFTDILRKIVVVRKIKSTEKTFPRKMNKIKKK